MKTIKFILKIAIPLLCICLVAFIVLHLTPELAIRADMLRLSIPAYPKTAVSVFSNDYYFYKNPPVHNLSSDKYDGKGTLYSAGRANYLGYGYYLVRKDGFLYFAKMIGND